MIVITILFYLWFLTSVVILVGRAIRRRRARRQRRDGLHVALHDPPAFEAAATDAPQVLVCEKSPDALTLEIVKAVPLPLVRVTV